MTTFHQKNDSLPITLTCSSTSGTNRCDKSKPVEAELFKNVLDQPSKILFFFTKLGTPLHFAVTEVAPFPGLIFHALTGGV